MLDSKSMQLLKHVIRTYLPDTSYKAFIFGSRATGTARKFSDIDIGIIGDKLPTQTIISLEEAFEESDLPYTVDIVEFNETSAQFKNVAMQHVIYLN